MAVTNILSSIIRTNTYPISKTVNASNNCGTFCLTLSSTWTEQMLSELPTLNISFWTDSTTRIASIDVDMKTVNDDTIKISPTEPYAIPMYDLPTQFIVKITPLFDQYALYSHNEQIKNGNIESFNTSAIGVVDTNTDSYSSELWNTPTSTFNVSLDFDDTNLKAGGGGGGGASTATDVSYDNSTSGLSATNVQDAIDEVQDNIDNLPEPMIFKGSLGTGGTITSLPTASEGNKGFTYKVITAGTYQGVEAKVGDTLISDGTTWVLIPSGDEPSGTVTNVDIQSTNSDLTVAGSPITSSGTISIQFTPTILTQEAYDAITNKDLPLYFIYET